MNDTSAEAAPSGPAAPLSEAPAPLHGERSARKAPERLVAASALVLALLALLFSAWEWRDTRKSLGALRQEAAQKLSEADTLNKGTRVMAGEAREASAEAQVKVGVLESRIAESQSQQIALEALYQELSRNRDESALAEIEQSLLSANQQLQLAGNVKGALIGLQNADTRLQRMDRPQLTALRKAVNRDIERLKALPYVDTVGISVRLDNIIGSVDALPLAMEMRPPITSGSEAPRPRDESLWQRFAREAWAELKQLVRVQDMNQPEVPLLAPSQAFFLRENLKLRLMGARLALLSRDQTSYKADLQAARDWLTRYYDAREKSVANTLVTLRNLHNSDISIETPDISGTLDALRNLRLGRDRPGR
jgi:uroporphyrin-3 C-methyltransferase